MSMYPEHQEDPATLNRKQHAMLVDALGACDAIIGKINQIREARKTFEKLAEALSPAIPEARPEADNLGTEAANVTAIADWQPSGKPEQQTNLFQNGKNSEQGRAEDLSDDELMAQYAQMIKEHHS